MEHVAGGAQQAEQPRAGPSEGHLQGTTATAAAGCPGADPL